MNSESLKEKTANGLLWGGLSNALQQLLGLVFGIFLARLLSQADYGMVGVLTVFSNIAAALQEGGFISALNKRKQVADSDYNAVFWFSTLCSVTIYILLFFLAPIIAKFYNEPLLTPLSRYLFLGFVISSLGIAPRAILFRTLKVRESSIIGLCALAVSGMAGIGMAACGMAFWGLATQTIVFVLTSTCLNFAFTRWHPKWKFNLKPIREMLGFGSRLIVTNVFTIINQNLFSNLLGRFYTVTDVGNFSQANKWNYMGHTLITNMLAGVAQPVFAKVEDDRARQLNIFRKLLRFTAFLCFPAMLGLSCVAHELIVLTITERWADSAHILSLLCIWGAFVPVCSLFSNLLISRGHSGIYMWCTIALCLLQLAAMIAVHSQGLDAMLHVFVGINIAWLLVWHYFVQREIGLRLRDMVLDMAPYFALSAALTAGASWLAQDIDNNLARLAVKIAAVGTLYIGILKVAGSVILNESIDFLAARIKTRRNKA